MSARKSLPLLFLVFAGVAIESQDALADAGPRYTYVEGGWQHVEISGVGVLDGENPDGNGYSVAGSYAVTDLFHVFASYGTANIDIIGESVDFSELKVGAGVNYAVTDTIDVVGRAAYLDLNADIDSNNSASDTGYGLEAGIRGMATPSIEVNGGLSYEDLGDASPSDKVAVKIGALYSFTDWLAVGIGGSFSAETKIYGANLRAYFGGN
jgi:hypothetical protein